MTLPTNIQVADVVAVPFRDGEVLAVDLNGKPHIILKAAFDAIGLDADRQIKKIQKLHWAKAFSAPVRGADGRPREMVVADLRTFLMALATIPVSRVAEAVQQNLMDYQNEVADVIEAYWTNGNTVSRRQAEHAAPVAIAAQAEIDRANVAYARIRVLGAGLEAGLFDKPWASAKAHVVAAEGFGEEPEIPAEKSQLYVPNFIKSKGVKSKKDIASIMSWFGRRVADVCEANDIEVPEKRPRELPDGTIRDTIAWRMEHLPQFEQVWETYYAAKYDRPEQLELGAA